MIIFIIKLLSTSKVRQGFDHIYTVAVDDKPSHEFATTMTSQTLNYRELPVNSAAKVCTDVAYKLFEGLFLCMF